METNLWNEIKAFFRLQDYMEDEQAIVTRISDGVTFKGPTLWVLIFAILIASLGLNVNSTAVIIGAMLISPLMGPIIGMGLAVGINDLDLLKRAALNFAVATGISILTATLYFLIPPLSEAQSELLARTSPTLYDVLIAFCGGAAGIIALCTRGNTNVIPGVAIATALMPPLCTAGYGLATGHLLYFAGAFFLFFINTVFISLATYMGVRLMGFHEREFASPERMRATRRVLMTVVILTMIPAAFMTFNIVRDSFTDGNVKRFVKAELRQSGTQVLSTSLDNDAHTLRVVAVGRILDDNLLETAYKRLGDYGLQGYKLSVIQGSQSDSLLSLGGRLAMDASSRESDRRKLLELSATTAALNDSLAPYTRLDAVAAALNREAAALFPTVASIGLARVAATTSPTSTAASPASTPAPRVASTAASTPAAARPDTTTLTHYVAAIVTTTDGRPLSAADASRLHSWLQLRLAVDSLAIFSR